MENKLITQLDVLVEGGRGDEHYKDLFQTIMTDLCEKHSTMREQGLKLVKTVTRLMEHLLEYRSIITDENRENRMSCTVNLLNFYNEIGRKEMYIRYLNKVFFYFLFFLQFYKFQKFELLFLNLVMRSSFGVRQFHGSCIYAPATRQVTPLE